MAVEASAEGAAVGFSFLAQPLKAIAIIANKATPVTDSWILIVLSFVHLVK
jgi:hypothetical protein